MAKIKTYRVVIISTVIKVKEVEVRAKTMNDAENKIKKDYGNKFKISVIEEMEK